MNVSGFYRGKVMLVTGGAGSIGSRITRRLLELEPAAVRVLDNNETGLFDLDQELDHGIRLFVGDIRDKSRLSRAIEGVDVVFHAAALKHIPISEYNPFEAVRTNTIGTQNLIDVAIDEGVDRLITVSTDKAASPVNVVGATKLLAERLTVAANLYKGEKGTALSCVRFGNVTETRGSAIPLFRKQIMSGGPVTVTDPEMTRFMMNISEAVKLVLDAAALAKGGEIFIFKMPALRLGDLAEVMVEKLAPRCGHDPSDIEIRIIGRRPGEKLHEDLMTGDDLENAYENEEMYLVVPHGSDEALRDRLQPGKGFKKMAGLTCSSADSPLLSREEIASMIEEGEVL
jgi:FlaA1/EpsC-like NDP-sugar epimerase